MGVAAYLFLRSKGSNSVSESNIQQKVALPEVITPDPSIAINSQISNIQNKIENLRSEQSHLLGSGSGLKIEVREQRNAVAYSLGTVITQLNNEKQTLLNTLDSL